VGRKVEGSGIVHTVVVEGILEEERIMVASEGTVVEAERTEGHIIEGVLHTSSVAQKLLIAGNLQGYAIGSHIAVEDTLVVVAEHK
jgi:hypothetical protein